MSKPAYKRSARVGDQMKEELADILMRKIKDPRIRLVTVTEVVLSDDLRNAKVFISSCGGGREETLNGLKSASAFIRAELGRRMRLKFIPEIIFRYDETVERGAHIMELLHQIEKDRDGTHEDDEE
jgi:ribosome-binding factor A